MRLKFIADAYYNGVHAHIAGQIYELDDSLGYASRWIKRGIAIQLAEELEVEPLSVQELEVVPPATEEIKQEVEIVIEEKQTINVEPKPRSSKKKTKYSLGSEAL